MKGRFRPQQSGPNWAEYPTEHYWRNYSFNQRVLGSQFIRLHYLALHAPAEVRRRNLAAYRRFCRQHFARTCRASIFFINNYTMERWL